MLNSSRSIVVAALAASWISFTSPAVRALCQGDCNGDGLVTVDELIRAVSISLENTATPYRLCPPVDTNGDAAVTVDEIVSAVNVSATACPETEQVYRAPEQTLPAGPIADGRGIMPNGRRINPAGQQIDTATLPLNLALTQDGKYLLITNDGYADEHGKQYVQVLDTQTLQLTKAPAQQFFGIAVTAAADRVFVAGDYDAGPDPIQALDLNAGVLTPEANPIATLADGTLPSGIALSPDGSHLFVVGFSANAFYSIDLASGTIHEADKKIGNLPLGLIVSPNGQRAYV
ncbi:MAG TPA: hypothetical protein VMT89_10860, partial [Candidatus Acidoferrales bacterium]|nr:hypothetical protein [Candidatus Acidoferrales bacterium]